jgi:hypothetical protein
MIYIKKKRYLVPLLGVVTGLALVALATGLSACGSSEERITADEASRQILLGLSDLPSGSKQSDEPLAGERCSPASHFRKYAQSVLSTSGFYLPRDQLLQQVGIFDRPSEAAKASRRVLSTKARRCVEGEMQATSISLAGSKGVITSRRLPGPALGDVTARGIRLHFTHPLGRVDLEQTTMVEGRALTTLTFISQNHSLSRHVWRAVANSTAASLRKASSDLEVGGEGHGG